MNIQSLASPTLWIIVGLYLLVLVILYRIFPVQFDLSQVWKDPGNKGFEVSNLYLLPLFVLLILYGTLKLILG